MAFGSLGNRKLEKDHHDGIGGSNQAIAAFGQAVIGFGVNAHQHPNGDGGHLREGEGNHGGDKLFIVKDGAVTLKGLAGFGAVGGAGG